MKKPHFNPSANIRNPLHISKHPPSSKFFSKFFFSENFSSYKMEHTPSNEIFFWKISPFTRREVYTINQKNFSDDIQSLRFFFYKAGWTIESEEKSSFQPLPLIVFEAHVLFHKTGERYALFKAHPFSLSYFLFVWSGYDIFPFI